jgi:lysophospholipase L1-like esterase
MNDEGKSTDAGFVRAVTATFQELRSRLPHAQIVAVNPFWDAAAPPARLAAMAQEIAAAVRAVGGIYLDIGDPLLGHPNYVGPDGVHPNDVGHAALAAAFIQAYAAI